MQTIRQPAVAGMFYPSSPQQLSEEVRRHLDEGRAVLAERTEPLPPGRPTAIVAPHAGYPYSGPIAGTAFAALERNGDNSPPIRRALILGPSHRVAFRGLAAPAADAFDTPLGPVTVDRQAIGEILALPHVNESDAAHRQEHSLEVELPFLLAVAGPKVQIVPLVVGEADPDEIAEVLETLQTSPNTVTIVSSDLSHYLPYPVAENVDAQTAEHILSLNADALCGERACGFKGIQGLITYARRHNIHPALLDLRNSGDTAGPRDQVVGYGAFAFI